MSSVSDTRTTKANQLKRMGEILQLLSSHNAILLLKHSFSPPKLLYKLRTPPCFLSPVLQDYDELLKPTLSGITSIHSGEVDQAWRQATIPVPFGGLGITECSRPRTVCLLGFNYCLLRPGSSSHPNSPPRLITSQCE